MGPARDAALVDLSKIIVTGCLLALLSGCAAEPPRTYTPPTGADAEACLQVCKSGRFACRTEALQEYEGCQQIYEYRLQRWRACVQTRGERRCAGQKPFPCPSPAYQRCTDGYDSCFLGCGGRID